MLKVSIAAEGVALRASAVTGRAARGIIELREQT